MIYVKRQRTVKVRQSSGFTIRSQMRLLLIKQPQTCYFTKKAEIQEPMHRDLHYQISGLSKPGNLRVAKSRKRQTRLNYSASNINTTRVCTAAKKKRSYRSRIKPAVWEAATVCPRPLQVDLWPYDMTMVSESCVMWATSVPILVFLGLSVLDLGPMYATDRCQTSDANHRLMPPPYRGGVQ